MKIDCVCVDNTTAQKAVVLVLDIINKSNMILFQYQKQKIDF